MSETSIYQQVVTPCVQICSLDSDSGLCLGCNRTEVEIANWMSLTHEERTEVMKKLKDR